MVLLNNQDFLRSLFIILEDSLWPLDLPHRPRPICGFKIFHIDKDNLEPLDPSN